MGMSGAVAPHFSDVDAAQKIADLEAALENLQKVNATLEDERRTLVQARIELNADLRRAYDLVEKRGKEIKGLEAKISVMGDEVERLEDKVEDLEAHPVGQDEVRELARVRAMMKRGDVDAARDGLERTLDGLNNCWRTIGTGALL